MKQSWFVKFKEFFAKRSSKPWACFETDGPSADGRLEFSISWNTAFVEKLKQLGYTGGNEEELVHLFFLSTRVFPENMMLEDTVNPDQMPHLSSEANILRK